MKEYLNKLPKEIQDLIHKISTAASDKGVSVYLVGGFVRDLLLGVENLDLDIVVAGDGIKFAEQLSAVLNTRLVRHHRFGTATLISGRHNKIDVASARKEFYPAPGHLPVVSAGALRDDLFRRDFTINAMAISISEENFGELADYFGGRPDLSAKKIRILHELSFIDDPTRILRAVRFEQRYNFRIEPFSLRKIKDAAKSKMLERVDAQRIRDELLLMLKEKDPLKELKRLSALAGFSFLLPQLRLSEKNYGLMRRVEKEIRLYSKIYPLRRNIDRWLVYFMCMTDSLSVSHTQKLCRKLALRQGEEKRVVSYKRINKEFLRHLSRKNIKPSRIFALLEPLSYEVILLLKAESINRTLKEHIDEFLEIYNGMRIFTSGHDLHGLGIAPGPKYKKIFSAVLSAKLDGRVKTKEEEMDLIGKLIRQK